MKWLLEGILIVVAALLFIRSAQRQGVVGRSENNAVEAQAWGEPSFVNMDNSYYMRYNYTGTNNASYAPAGSPPDGNFIASERALLKVMSPYAVMYAAQVDSVYSGQAPYLNNGYVPVFG